MPRPSLQQAKLQTLVFFHFLKRLMKLKKN